MKIFDDLVQDVLRERWRTSPVTATIDGVHEFDDQLDIYDADFRLDVAKRKNRLLLALRAVPDDELDLSRRIDKAALLGALRASIDDIEIVQNWRRNPALYLQIGLYGLYFLLARNFAPAKQRADHAARRGEAFPRLLHEGKSNIVAAPPIHLKTAFQVAEGARTFIRDGLHPFLAKHDHGRADSVAANCLSGIDEYVSYLHSMSGAQHAMDFAVGTDAFQLKVKTEHGLTYSPEQLLEMGEEGRRNTLRLLEEEAARIDSTAEWPELLERYSREHPTADGLLKAYAGEVKRARTFLEDTDLVTLPAEESLEVVPTPEFDRPIIPYAAMMPPAPFDKEHQRGFFFVTPVEDGDVARIREHNIHAMALTSVHEAYPGHHVQFSLANNDSSPVRKLFKSSVTIEGWALYSEELMHEQGFFPAQPTRLFQLKNLLWRAVRVILDVRLQTKGMKPNDAVDFLVNEVKLERSNAEAEIRRYAAAPTQPMSYFIGKHEILSLRRELRLRRPGEFSLRAFHDALLSWGNIPIPLIREAMLADPAYSSAA